MDDISMKLISAYFAQIDSAMKISEILSEHGDEEEISPDNLILGLIYRLMVPMTEEEKKRSLDVTKKIMDPETSSDEETENEELLSEETLLYGGNDKKISRKIKTNHCNCEICMKARVCLLNYPAYESTDIFCLLYTSPSPRDRVLSRMPSSA